MAAVVAAPFAANPAVKMAAASRPYLGSSRFKETTALITEFNHLSWVSATGGSIPIKVHGDSILKLESLIAMSPRACVQWEPLPSKLPECFDFGPLPLKLGLDWSRTSHGLTRKPNGVPGGHRNDKVSPKAGISSNAIESSQRCIVLDIEGTTTPISFVIDVLFPYARDNVGKHLELTYDTEETQDDIKLLQTQVQEDLENGVAGAVSIPLDGSKEEVIAALVANVEAMIKADRKITSLKQLQGHIWRTGFQREEIEAVVYDDVPNALKEWHALGIKVYIYSSGSRLAQRLIFGNTNYGDLRKYLCGFFDTTVGNKKETRSYIEIAESLGVDDPSEILFITDVYPEATAANAAGLDVIISIRPGNGPLPENHGFRTVKSFSEI